MKNICLTSAGFYITVATASEVLSVRKLLQVRNADAAFLVFLVTIQTSLFSLMSDLVPSNGLLKLCVHSS